LAAWESHWPEEGRPTAKVIYDRNAAEARVHVHKNGKTETQSFIVGKELAGVMSQVKAFIAEKVSR
jgi:hypothetical protein